MIMVVEKIGQFVGRCNSHDRESSSAENLQIPFHISSLFVCNKLPYSSCRLLMAGIIIRCEKSVTVRHYKKIIFSFIWRYFLLSRKKHF
jgi:hypothetical protein